jgi:hypothetical protein
MTANNYGLGGDMVCEAVYFIANEVKKNKEVIYWFLVCCIFLIDNFYFFYCANVRFSDVRVSRNFGIVVLPIPCSFKISSSLYLESSFNVVMWAFSSARRAGAESRERKPIFGLRCVSHIGQVGQSLLL